MASQARCATTLVRERQSRCGGSTVHGWQLWAEDVTQLRVYFWPPMSGVLCL